jgi:UDP-glucuronate 4-epimerase
MRKILITGGAGFIGSHLSEQLVKDNNIIILDNFDRNYDPRVKIKNISNIIKKTNFSLIKGDIRNNTIIKQVFTKYRPDIVIHLAAKSGVRESVRSPQIYAKVNIIGTLNLLENSFKFKVKNFIFASSSSVYGNNKTIPFKETDIADNQISPYAFTKRAGELICQQYSANYCLPVTCLRLFTVYGPRQRPNMAISKFINNILSDIPITINGDGSIIRDFVYISDVLEAFSKCLDKTFKFEIFNIGSSYKVDLNKLITLIEIIINRKAVRVYKPEKIVDMKKTFSDTTKAKQILGWKALTTLKSGLENTVVYFKAICK